LPNSASTIDIHHVVVRYRMITFIGIVCIVGVLLSFAIAGISILQYSTIGVPVDLTLPAAWLLINVGLAVRVRPTRYALPLATSSRSLCFVSLFLS
jgi:hypothetical protein